MDGRNTSMALSNISENAPEGLQPNDYNDTSSLIIPSSMPLHRRNKTSDQESAKMAQALVEKVGIRIMLIYEAK